MKIIDFQPRTDPKIMDKRLDANDPPMVEPKLIPKEGFNFPSVRELDLVTCDRPSPGKRKFRDFQEIRDIFELGMQQTPKKRRGIGRKNQL